MKKAFTLIELLIVVTVMAVLMTITFRLGNVSDDKTKLVTTVTRMQRLENCLSGYYAAFGSYPPVAIYGSRDINTEVRNGIQDPGNKTGGTPSWEQIDAACRSQPVDACFPFSEGAKVKEMIEGYSSAFQEAAQNWPADTAAKYGSTFTGDFMQNVRGGDLWNNSSWNKVQIFKFGLMSYLLPRYLVMMSGNPYFYGGKGANACAQWTENNDECVNAVTGEPMNWNDVYDNVGSGDQAKNRNRTGNNRDYMTVANMPTQAVCARWIKHLEGICATGDAAERCVVFGVCIKDKGWDMWSANSYSGPSSLELYSPRNSGSNWYVLNTISVHDGWHNRFYYYSPNGSQSYTLWSAGPNGKTFPPWVNITGYADLKPASHGSGGDLTIAKAVADDIIRMHH